MSLGGLGEEGVTVHLESGRFWRTACQEEILLQQLGKEQLVDLSSPSEPPILVIRVLTAGEPARQTIEQARWLVQCRIRKHELDRHRAP